MENILKELGFTNDVGYLWIHNELDIIIGITEKSKPSDIVKEIFRTGEWYGLCAVMAELRTNKTE